MPTQKVGHFQLGPFDRLHEPVMRVDHGLEGHWLPSRRVGPALPGQLLLLRACARVASSRWLGGKIRHVPCRPFDA
jgi:hypothetical protein